MSLNFIRLLAIVCCCFLITLPRTSHAFVLDSGSSSSSSSSSAAKPPRAYSPRIRGVVSPPLSSSSCLYAVKKKKKTAASSKEKVETLKKPDVVDSVRLYTGLSKVDSEAAVNAVLDTIREHVADGKRINLVGFGTFKLSHRAARKGRNPQTGETIDIRASNSPSFTAAKPFKEQCNPDR